MRIDGKVPSALAVKAVSEVLKLLARKKIGGLRLR